MRHVVLDVNVSRDRGGERCLFYAPDTIARPPMFKDGIKAKYTGCGCLSGNRAAGKISDPRRIPVVESGLERSLRTR